VERGLFIAATGMLANQLRQDVIANNLANATTAGYKGDRAVQQAFPAMLLQQVQTGRQIGSLSLGTRVADVVTDGSQGAIRNTGNAYDLAIAGDGFFSVQAATGVRYTRDGSFSVDAKNQLVTARGEPVLDKNNRPITIPASGDRATIDEQGNVIANGRTIATLAVTVLDPQTLRKQGDDLYQGTPQRGGAQGRVEQGYLEQSNVNSVREMVDLIETMRSFEASQKVTQSLDETLGKAIEVGRL
jgi:flagellar basal-body rod protein FlgF